MKIVNLYMKILTRSNPFEQAVLVYLDPNDPDAGNNWIRKVCSMTAGLKDIERGWPMKLFPGEDVTPEEPLPLDELLLDEDVITVLKKNHPELLVDGKLLEDEETLRLFFGEQRDANLIATLINTL